GLRIWDVATVQVLWVSAPGEQGASAGQVVFTPDGKSFATAGTRLKGISFWDVSTGKFLKTLPASESFYVTAISLDARWLAGTHGSRFRVWNLETGQPVPDGHGHFRPIERLAFSPRLDATPRAVPTGQCACGTPPPASKSTSW